MPDTAKLHTMIKVLFTRKQRAKSAAVYINCFNLNRDWNSRRPAISFQTKPAHIGLLHLHLLVRHQSFGELFYCSEGFETYLIFKFSNVSHSFHADSDSACVLPARTPRCNQREWAKFAPSVWSRWLLVNLAWTLDLHHRFAAHKTVHTADYAADQSGRHHARPQRLRQ